MIFSRCFEIMSHFQQKLGATAREHNFTILQTRGVGTQWRVPYSPFAEQYRRRTRCCSTLRNSTSPTGNISLKGFQVLKKSITVPPTYEVDTTVRMDTANHKRKMNFIQQDSAYKRIKTETTVYLEKTSRLKSDNRKSTHTH